MNKIVRNHYPASNLPDDLRGGIDPSAEVAVTVEELAAGPSVTLDEIFARRQPPFRTAAEIDRMIREGRDDDEQG